MEQHTAVQMVAVRELAAALARCQVDAGLLSPVPGPQPPPRTLGTEVGGLKHPLKLARPFHHTG